MSPQFFIGPHQRANQSPVFNLKISGKAQCTTDLGRDARFQSPRFIVGQPFNFQAFALLPFIAPPQFGFILLCKAETESASSIELNIDSGFFFEQFSELGIEIAAGAGELKKIVLMIDFNLGRENSAGGPGSFGARPAAFNQHQFANAALRQLLRNPGVVTIPKATQPEHVRANIKAVGIELDAEDLAALDAAFPPPKRSGPLEMT